VVVLVGFSAAPPEELRVACVGDSLTQSSGYPFDLLMLLGFEHYELKNFGAGGTTVSLDSETPYMNTSAFQEALDFQPDVVIVMLGTNDAQPSLHRYNTTFVADYLKLLSAFQNLSSNPKIWTVLPPPIFSDQSGKIAEDYFESTVLPGIEEVANRAHLPVIDVYSALLGHPEYFRDGIHPNDDNVAAQIIANQIYKAIT
jgi:lysophospholipase L1-like esterase